MAENKKIVYLYCDLIHTVEKLGDEDAGKLFKHYLRYVNNLNPEPENMVVDLVFEHIKLQLKRDLNKWEERAERSRENGKLGGRPKTQKTQKTQEVISKPRKPVTVTVTDTVKVKDSKKGFIPPTIEDFQKYIDENGYDLDGENIYKGYEENDWKDSREKPIKNWKQKLRQVWFKPESKKKPDSEKSNYELIIEFKKTGFSKFREKYGFDKADEIGNQITK